MKTSKFLIGLSYITLGALLASMLFVFWPQPIITKELERSVHAKSRATAKDLAFDLEVYLADFDGRLPDAKGWIDAINLGSEKQTEIVSIPAERSSDGKPYFFSFFEPLSGVDASTVLNPESVPVFFETEGGAPNFSCSLEEIAWPHSGSVVVVFLDGHVESMPDAWQLETVKIEFLPASGSSDPPFLDTTSSKASN